MFPGKTRKYGKNGGLRKALKSIVSHAPAHEHQQALLNALAESSHFRKFAEKHAINSLTTARGPLQVTQAIKTIVGVHEAELTALSRSGIKTIKVNKRALSLVAAYRKWGGSSYHALRGTVLYALHAMGWHETPAGKTFLRQVANSSREKEYIRKIAVRMLARNS